MHATQNGGPRRYKAALWLQPRAPQLPALGRLYSAQDGARPDFGRRPRPAAVAGFGPDVPARPGNVLSCNPLSGSCRKASTAVIVGGAKPPLHFLRAEAQPVGDRVAQGRRASGSRWFPLSSVQNQQAIRLTRRPGASRSRPAEPEAKLCRPPVAGIAAELRSPETERQQP